MDEGKPDYTLLEFPAPPDARPYVVINMVASLDGRVVIEGTERGLGSKVDQRLMRELRYHADVVMNGANTLRASGTSSRVGDAELEERRIAQGKTRHPIAAVITASGSLPLDRSFFTARDFDAIVYLSERTPEDRRRAIEATGRRVQVLRAGEEIHAMLRHMRAELGASLLLVEGGPTLNAELFDLDAVDELFLTLGGLIVGGRDPLTMIREGRERSAEHVRRMDLVHAVPNRATNEVYLRYRRPSREA
ncbi:MAG TPA: dihydrofolate reductase family protein [Dehalococcoidia bacterium]|nr:dihydrofolate reductase family protein [Dehalococcoidia bacterium]